MVVAINEHMIGANSGGNESHCTNILRSIVVPKGNECYLIIDNSFYVASNKYIADDLEIVPFLERMVA